jgi:hypothetical protein
MPYPYGSEHPDHHYEDMAGKLIEFTHDGIALHMRDDGPTNAFWTGPGPMPEALRRAGLVDMSEGESDESE